MELSAARVGIAAALCAAHLCLAEQIDVPITVGAGLPIAKVTVDGKAECWAVVDTGSSVTVISPTAFGMTTTPEQSPRDGKPHILAKKQPKLTIGTYTPATVTVLVAALPAMDLTFGGRHIQMLLGRDVLGQCAFGIDLERSSMTFFRGEKITPDLVRDWLVKGGPVAHRAFAGQGDVVDLPMTLIGHRGQAATESVWAFDSWLGPRQQAWLVFDTGNNRMALSQRLEQGADWKIVSTAPVETPLGAVQRKFVTVPRLIVGSLLLRDADGWLQSYGTPDDGYIGPKGLGVKRFLLDPEKLILHVPNGDNDVRWLHAPTKGSALFLFKDGTSVVQNGPCEYTVDDVSKLEDVFPGPTAKVGYVDHEAGGKTSRTYTLR